MGGAPTWARDVAPLVFERCAPCHRPGEVAPFALLTYEDVSRRSRQIAQVTRSRYMPPWQPEPGYANFRDSRALTDDEIDLLRRWFEAGAPRGDSAGEPEPPRFASGWQLGEPDLVVSMPESYAVGADMDEDVFRNFVVPLGLERTRYVQAVEFRPDNRRLVHHAQILIDSEGNARQLDEMDPDVGYSGMVGAGAPGGHFLGWTPGRQPTRLDDGMAFEVRPGSDLVFETHLLPTGKREELSCSVGLYFSEEKPRVEPASVHLASTTIDLPPGASDVRVRDELELPTAVSVLGIYPHAHYLGKQIDVWAQRTSGEKVWLLKITDWDFDWQDEYHYETPLHLEAGATLHLEIGYDNSADNVRNPFSPPQRITWGPRSTDEMGDVWIKVVPVAPGDLGALKRATFSKDLELARAGYEFTLELDPTDFEANNLLGLMELERGRLGRSIDLLERALEQRPESWSVMLNVAGANLRAGQVERALMLYRDALERRPEHAETHSNLAVALARTGDVRDAISHHQTAIELAPDDGSARNNYGVLLMQIGAGEQALEQLRLAVELAPEYLPAQKNLANLLARTGEVDRAVAVLERLVDAAPDDIEARQLLALGLVELGRVSEAMGQLERVLEIDPDNRQAREDLRLLRAQ